MIMEENIMQMFKLLQDLVIEEEEIIIIVDTTHEVDITIKGIVEDMIIMAMDTTIKIIMAMDTTIKEIVVMDTIIEEVMADMIHEEGTIIEGLVDTTHKVDTITKGIVAETYTNHGKILTTNSVECARKMDTIGY